MKYKNIQRLICTLYEYNEIGIIGVLKDELEDDYENWEIISINDRTDHFTIWIGELSLASQKPI